MSVLHQKLEKLKQKQAEVERQLAVQAAAENAIVAKAFGLIVSTSAGAYKSAQSSGALDSLNSRERATFDNWLNRIEPPVPANSAGSTTGHQFGSTESKSGLPE